jgi:F-type H+-transporting ATPase subunit b
MLLNIDEGLIIWTIITFILLLLVLKAVAWKPLLAMLDERERRIRESLNQAEKAREEAQNAADENRRTMAHAQAEARQAVSEGREAAERAAAEVRARAADEAQQMLQQARRTIRQEKEQAIQELRTHAASLAIEAAGKVLDENLDNARNRKLVDEFIDSIPDTDQN